MYDSVNILKSLPKALAGLKSENEDISSVSFSCEFCEQGDKDYQDIYYTITVAFKSKYRVAERQNIIMSDDIFSCNIPFLFQEAIDSLTKKIRETKSGRS